MNKSNLLINENPLQVLPSLAVAIGLNEAIALQQVHYWLNNAKNAGRVDKNGDKWVYNTYAQWKEDNFPFWSEDKIQRVFLSLEKQGVLISAQLDANLRDMTKFYRIDYDALCAMDSLKSAPSITANLHDVKMNQRLHTETTTDIKTPIFSKKEQTENDKKMRAILELNSGGKDYWQGRELVRADHLPLADWYNKATGQVVTKRSQKSWWKALGEWTDEGLKVEHLQEAFSAQSKWRLVSDPNMLTKDAIAVKSGTRITGKNGERNGNNSKYVEPPTYTDADFAAAEQVRKRQAERMQEL